MPVNRPLVGIGCKEKSASEAKERGSFPGFPSARFGLRPFLPPHSQPGTLFTGYPGYVGCCHGKELQYSKIDKHTKETVALPCSHYLLQKTFLILHCIQ